MTNDATEATAEGRTYHITLKDGKQLAVSELMMSDICEMEDSGLLGRIEISHTKDPDTGEKKFTGSIPKRVLYEAVIRGAINANPDTKPDKIRDTIDRNYGLSSWADDLEGLQPFFEACAPMMAPTSLA